MLLYGPPTLKLNPQREPTTITSGALAVSLIGTPVSPHTLVMRVQAWVLLFSFLTLEFELVMLFFRAVLGGELTLPIHL